jgi:hypothetical protein
MMKGKNKFCRIQEGGGGVMLQKMRREVGKEIFEEQEGFQ